MSSRHKLSRPGHQFAFTVAVFLLLAAASAAQDWIRTGTGLGVEKVRLAAADFKSSTSDAKNADLLKTFNDTLWNDLDNAGIFDLVSKSFYPLQNPGQPSEINFSAWNSPPPKAAMLAFGNLGVTADKVAVQGWLYDLSNQASPQVLGKQYNDAATSDAVRTIAHKFADEIIFRLGGGIPGIAESKIYFVKEMRPGVKEIWMMDYDGANQTQLTHLGAISLSPRISPDGSRLAFSSTTKNGWEITMYSFDLNRIVAFPHFGGMNLSPSWSPDGKIAFSSSRNGYPNIYVVDGSGGNLHRLTTDKGPDVAPTWNRKTGSQIAFVSGRTGLPQIYTMEADGTNLQRVTDQGYAVSPNWSPNGQFLTFSWTRKYGPGEPGSNDIYLMDIASKQWVQLTHDAGRNDFPCWSPDGRHIVFQSHRSGTDQIFSMLADGSNVKQLTTKGNNTQPNWSWK